MLLWELWHEHEPFDNDVALCQQYVLQEDARPMIVTEELARQEANQNPDNGDLDSSGSRHLLFCDEDIAKLIRLCW